MRDRESRVPSRVMVARRYREGRGPAQGARTFHAVSSGPKMVALHTNRLSSLWAGAAAVRGFRFNRLEVRLQPQHRSRLLVRRLAITPAVQKARPSSNTHVSSAETMSRGQPPRVDARRARLLNQDRSKARQTANARRGVRRCGDRGTCRAYRVERIYRVGGHENLTRTSGKRNCCHLADHPAGSQQSRRVTMSSAAFYESLYPATTAIFERRLPRRTARRSLPPMPSSPICAWAFVRRLLASGVSGAISASLSARVSSPAPGAKHAETSPGVSPSSGLAWPALSPPRCWCDPTWPLRRAHAASLSHRVRLHLGRRRLPRGRPPHRRRRLGDPAPSSVPPFIHRRHLCHAAIRQVRQSRRLSSASRARSARLCRRSRSRSLRGAPMCRPVRGDDDRKHGRDDRRATRRWCALAGVSWVMAAAAPLDASCG